MPRIGAVVPSFGAVVPSFDAAMSIRDVIDAAMSIRGLKWMTGIAGNCIILPSYGV